MTSREYNVTGVLGAKASRQNASALHHLGVELGGQSPVTKIAKQIASVCMHAKRPLSATAPIVWSLEPRYVQLRQAIIAKLGENCLIATAQGLRNIVISGLYTPEIEQ